MSNYTIQCKHCGEMNDTTTSVCINCNTPLTAYGGQLGQEENFTRKLSTQISALDHRPRIVDGAVVFQALWALAVPLWTVVRVWATRPQVNEEGTNGIQAAGGIFASIIQSFLLVPLALGILFVAYSTWTQKEWAWKANHAVFAVIAVTPILLQGFVPATWFWIVLVVVFEILWNRSGVKAWFALE